MQSDVKQSTGYDHNLGMVWMLQEERKTVTGSSLSVEKGLTMVVVPPLVQEEETALDQVDAQHVL